MWTRNETKNRKAKQHEKEKEYMKALKQVKETGIYKEPQVAQESTESSSDDEPSGVMKFISDELDSEGAVDSQRNTFNGSVWLWINISRHL